MYSIYVKNMADALKIACMCEDDEFLLMSSLQENDVKGPCLNLDDLSEEHSIHSSGFKEKTFLVCVMFCPFRQEPYVQMVPGCL